MAGNPEQKAGYKLANVIEEKSVVIRSLALVGSVFVPALLGLAAWEGAQFVLAKDYKNGREGKETVIFPGKRRTQDAYDLAA